MRAQSSPIKEPKASETQPNESGCSSTPVGDNKTSGFIELGFDDAPRGVHTSPT